MTDLDAKSLNSALPQGRARRGNRPEIALAVILACQLMLILDGSIVNVALPNIQRSLHFSATNLSWVLNAYSLAFGGLLLLGGRAGDILGRRRVFVAGALVFAAASLLGGFATSSSWLLITRGLQGVGAAAAAPSALALIASNFEEGPARTRAFSLYAAVGAGGASIGLIAGGMLTTWMSWRWVMFVNVPIGIAVALIAPLYINESERNPGRFDVLGALTSTSGVLALVYGFIRASSEGWSDVTTMAAFASAVVLLVGFVLIELRAAQPIMPLRLFVSRNRSSAYLINLLMVGGMIGMFFFVTQFVQNVLGFSPLKAGFSFLPLTIGILISVQVVARLLPRFGAKSLTIAGAVVATIGMAWLSRISIDSGYFPHIVVPTMLMGIGVGFPLVTLTLVAMAGVSPSETGAGSGLINVVQQVGGSLGLAILVTVFGIASRKAADRPVSNPVEQAHRAMVRGVGSAFSLATIFMASTFIIAVFAIRGKPRSEPIAVSMEPVAAH